MNSNATVNDLMDYLDNVAPFDLQEDYDNSGHLIGDPGLKIKGVLCALDCTEAIVEEAVERNCNVVIYSRDLLN